MTIEVILRSEILFSITHGLSFTHYLLNLLFVPVVSIALATAATIGAFTDRNWFQYPIYLLTAVVFSMWIKDCSPFWPAAADVHSWILVPSPAAGFFRGLGMALGFGVLSYMVFALTTQTPPPVTTITNIRPLIWGWRILGAIALLFWISHFQTTAFIAVIGLGHLGSIERIFTLLYFLLSLTYPLTYLLSLYRTRRSASNQNSTTMIHLANRPLIHIALGSASWLLSGLALPLALTKPC
ncbi:MAG: hypothetical protein KF814_09485 [Nitrospiraceae bacterium]|nr:hypothetical protein [Nitrospiraceae bacterium]